MRLNSISQLSSSFSLAHYKQVPAPERHPEAHKPCVLPHSQHKCSPGTQWWSNMCRGCQYHPSNRWQHPVIRQQGDPDASQNATSPLSLCKRMARTSRGVGVGCKHVHKRLYTSVCTQTTPLQQRDGVGKP